MAISRRVWRVVETLEEDESIKDVSTIYYDRPPEDSDNPGRQFQEEQRGEGRLGADLTTGQEATVTALINTVARVIVDENDPIS